MVSESSHRHKEPRARFAVTAALELEYLQSMMLLLMPPGAAGWLGRVHVCLCVGCSVPASQSVASGEIRFLLL